MSDEEEAKKIMREGIEHYDRNKYDLAISAWLKVTELKPDYANPYKNIAMACEKQGDKKKAITYYKRYISLLPADDFRAEETNRWIKELLEEDKPHKYF